MSRILIACEESQEVCKAFRNNGHEAFSCDLLPTSGANPEWHIQKDCLEVLISKNWDLVIAFPPCTDLAVSGARWFKEKQRDGRQQKSINFFMAVTNLCMVFAKRWAIENPIGIMSSKYRRPDQIIQPYQFGHPETKATCLWLKGLPKLKATENVYDTMITLPKTERNRILWLGSNKSKERSKTYPGIAKAMADQWSNLIL